MILARPRRPPATVAARAWAAAIVRLGGAAVNGMVLAAVRLLSRLSEEIEEYATARSALANAPQASGSPCDGSPPEPVAISQQPGSPLLPQQLLRVRILVQLLAKMRWTLRPSGICAPRLEKTARRLGMVTSVRLL